MKRYLLLLLFKLVSLPARELPLCHCEERQRRSNLKEGLLRPSTGSGLALSKRKRVEGLRSLRSLAMTRFIAMLAMTSLIFFSLAAQAQTPTEANAWSMSGANPQRTSWVPSTSENQTDIPGDLRPEWYIPIEPYIHPKFQVIVAYDTVFVSTARGLYAFDASTGTQKWVYPTELPLGNSPALYNGVAYVGGYDKRIHAVNINLEGITPGQGLWAYEAGAGFETNPLIIQPPASQVPILYAGSRDSYMYALDLSDPTNPSKQRLLWKFKTEGPILNSAAAKPDNSVIYFASNDSYGYALGSQTGNLIWKTAKLPGEGFGAWWPVYYHHPTEGDYVIFSGTWDYRLELGPGGMRDVLGQEYTDLFPSPITADREWVSPLTTTPVEGGWIKGAITRDTSQSNTVSNGTTTAVTEYFEEPTAQEASTDPAGLERKAHKPWRRLYLVMNASNGQEVTYDFDNDGQKEYAPITAAGITHYGNRFPPVVGGDSVLYQMFDGLQGPITESKLVGWKINTPYIRDTAYQSSSDEPVAFAAGGNRIYVNHTLDEGGGSFDITDLNPWGFNYYYNDYIAGASLDATVPGYNQGYIPTPDDVDIGDYGMKMFTFGGVSGSYFNHGYQSPPIPYKGRVYAQRGNSLIAFSLGATNADKLPTATMVSVQGNVPNTTKDDLYQRLETEIKKLDVNGDGTLDHLKPGFTQNGLHATIIPFTEDMFDYFHHPFETFYTLLRARPLIQDNSLRNQLDVFLQSEWTNFNPATINHIGWVEGEWRDNYDKLPEVTADLPNHPKQNSFPLVWSIGQWKFNPMAWYAMWMYADTYRQDITAASVLQSGLASSDLRGSFTRVLDPTAVTNTTLAEISWMHNGYLAGLIGFLNLYDLALSQGMAPYTGIVPNTSYTIQQFRDRKDELLALRVQNFSKKTPYPIGAVAFAYPGANGQMARVFNPSRSFIFMVPEVADYLRTSPLNCADGVVSLTCVQDTISQFDRITPYWLVSKFDATVGEGVFQPLYDYNSLFQARALILQKPFEELVKYLDVSAFSRGDLFYIDNLVSALEADSNASLPGRGDVNQDTLVNVLDVQACVNHILNIQNLGSSADVNQDGSVDVLDVQNIVNIILGV